MLMFHSSSKPVLGVSHWEQLDFDLLLLNNKCNINEIWFPLSLSISTTSYLLKLQDISDDVSAILY